MWFLIPQQTLYQTFVVLGYYVQKLYDFLWHAALNAMHPYLNRLRSFGLVNYQLT